MKSDNLTSEIEVKCKIFGAKDFHFLDILRHFFFSRSLSRQLSHFTLFSSSRSLQSRPIHYTTTKTTSLATKAVSTALLTISIIASFLNSNRGHNISSHLHFQTEHHAAMIAQFNNLSISSSSASIDAASPDNRSTKDAVVKPSSRKNKGRKKTTLSSDAGSDVGNAMNDSFENHSNISNQENDIRRESNRNPDSKAKRKHKRKNRKNHTKSSSKRDSSSWETNDEEYATNAEGAAILASLHGSDVYPSYPYDGGEYRGGSAAAAAAASYYYHPEGYNTIMPPQMTAASVDPYHYHHPPPPQMMEMVDEYDAYPYHYYYVPTMMDPGLMTYYPAAGDENTPPLCENVQRQKTLNVDAPSFEPKSVGE